MKPTHIEHLGIAVTSLEEAMPFFEFLTGGKCYSIEEVADQKVKTAFFKVGEVKIELLEATSPESSIAKFIEKNGGKGGIHHVAFNVDSVEEALAEADYTIRNRIGTHKVSRCVDQHFFCFIKQNAKGIIRIYGIIFIDVYSF